jgi:hypothetical protein
MKKRLSFLLTFVFLALHLTQATAQQKQWQGYKPTAKTGLKFADVIAAVTVKTITTGGTSLKESAYEIVDTDKEKQVKKHSTLDRNFRVFQIETCRRQNIKKCPVAKKFSNSTGTLEEGMHLKGCRHAFHNFLFLVAKNNPNDFINISPPLMILNSKDEIIYNSAYNSTQISTLFLNKDPVFNLYYQADNIRQENPKLYEYFFFTDYFEIEFSESIVSSPKLPRAGVIDNSNIFYISGYPGKTTFFGNESNGDSKGTKLVTSAGNFIHDFYDYQMTELSNFFSPGMSGGLVVNEKGEMLGVSCYGDSTKSQIIKSDRKKLTETWERLRREYFLN